MQRPTGADLSALIRLAFPIVAVQLGLMLMGVVDTAMVGRLSPEALAAVAIANVYFFALATLGMGCLMALDPIVAQAHGAGDDLAIARGMQRGALIALLVTVPVSLGLLYVEPVLSLFGQPAEIIPLAGRYTRVIVAGIFPFFGFLVFRQTLQAIGVITPMVVVIGIANLLNVVFNRVLIFGFGPIPPYGVAGAALATTIGRWFMLVAIAAVTWRAVAHHLVPWHRRSFALGPLLAMLRLGLPIGFQMTFEYGVFGMVGLLMGRIGTAAIAGHQVALNLAALTFMVPLGIGGAAAVLVGRAIGAGDAGAARRMAGAGLLAGVSFMSVTAVAFWLAPGLFGRFYTHDPAVLAVAGSLIPLAGLFQVFDGTQAVSLGVLRGANDTRVPVLINLLGYWMLGLPVSLFLGFRLGWGPRGLWWGLVIGLVVVALILLVRVRRRLGQQLQRVLLEAAP
jgi:MATE family, multidrug efflux pump